MNDLRFALRQLLKNPGFTTVIVFTLALSIGVTTTVFSWVRGVLLHPLRGVARPAEIVTLETVTPEGGYIDSSYPDFRDYRDRSTTLAGVLAAQDRPLSFGEDDQAERVWSQFVSGNYFDVLGVKPVVGRFFEGAEQAETPGQHPVVVLGARFWHRRFQSDPGIVGRTIRLNQQQLTVIGVAPAEFAGTIVGLKFDLWVPLMMEPLLSRGGNWFADRQSRPLHLLARLKPGVPLQNARAEVRTLSQQLARAFPASNQGIGATVLPVHQAPYGVQSRLGTLLEILLGASGLVLLIACANVANLLLARATVRRKEFAVRLALGASRARTIRQLLTESWLLAGLGGALGVLLASRMTGCFSLFLPATHLPAVFDFGLDRSALVFTVAISLAVGLIFGLAPALQTLGLHPLASLQENSRGATDSARSHRLRGMLVVSEVALALLALIGAGLFLSSFQRARRMDPGFDPRNVLLAGLNLSEQGYDRDRGRLFLQRVRERIEGLPGVRAVSFAEDVPLGFDGGSWEDLRIADYAPQPGENMKVYRNIIGPGYLDLMRIPLTAGREFTEHDALQSQPVAIVNESFARRFLSGGPALGRTFRGLGRDWTIVGVARDIKYQSLTERSRPYFYVPLDQVFQPSLGLGLHVRTDGAAESLLPTVRRELRALDPAVPIFEALTLQEYIGAAWFPQKIAATLLSALGALALILAAVGLFSVMAYTVNQRIHEIGIRLALGAQMTDILRLVVRQGMRLALLGVGIGVAGSLSLTPFLASQLLGVSPTDPFTFIAVSLAVLLVAAWACWLPARRAARVDPMVALRSE